MIQPAIKYGPREICIFQQVKFKGECPCIVAGEGMFQAKKENRCMLIMISLQTKIVLVLITGNVAFQVIEVDVTP